MTIEILQILVQISTIAGIFLLYRQIEIGHRIAASQLINELEKEFATYNHIFAKIKPGKPWHTYTELNEEQIAQLENLAAFCEKLNHFRERGILDWKTLDLMFRNRFFLIIHNIKVLKHV